MSYAGGYFTNIGGLNRSHIAKLSSTGTGAADATWNPSANWVVYALAVSGTNVYAGGGFTYVGGRSRNFIAKLAGTGTGVADATWNPSADYGVWSLALNGLYLYAGGGFTNIGGLHRAALAKLSTLGTGSADNTWEADCNADVNSIVFGSTALYVCGSFTQVAGQPRPGVAAIAYPPLWLLSPQRPAAGPFQCTLIGERGQGYEILTSSNLVNWDTLTTLINSTGTTNFTDSTPGFLNRSYRARPVQ